MSSKLQWCTLNKLPYSSMDGSFTIVKLSLRAAPARMSFGEST